MCLKGPERTLSCNHTCYPNRPSLRSLPWSPTRRPSLLSWTKAPGETNLHRKSTHRGMGTGIPRDCDSWMRKRVG